MCDPLNDVTEFQQKGNNFVALARFFPNPLFDETPHSLHLTRSLAQSQKIGYSVALDKVLLSKVLKR
jgi:hypothetical protein